MSQNKVFSQFFVLTSVLGFMCITWNIESLSAQKRTPEKNQRESAKDQSKSQTKAESKTKTNASSSSEKKEQSKKSKTKNQKPKIQSNQAIDRLIDTQKGDAQRRALWEDFKRHAALYVKRSQEYQVIHRGIFKEEYKEQENSIEKRYEPKIKSLESDESQQRQNSIQKFQEFLDEHKAHPQYTPDSLYRLAMLLLEEEDSRYLEKVEEYNRRLETASEDEELIPPQKNHLKIISTLDRLIQNWPQYHDLDSAFYARAHCYLEMGEEEKAIKDFQVIAQSGRFNNSQYYIEAWNLIGELHFKFAELQKAIHAYKQVIKDKESIYFMFAYYKLAWTYYRNDQFEDAVAYLKRLIQISDDHEKKGGKKFELRREAIDYLAISLNEEDWNDDGMIDAEAGFKRVKRFIGPTLSFRGELLETVIGIFFETSKYMDAIKTAEYLFEVEPFYKNNPVIHAQIITAYERVAQPDQAFKTRDRMTDVYVKDGPWYAYNHRDQKTIDQARILMKDALLQTGIFYFEQAGSLRDRSLQLEEVSDRTQLMKKAKYNYKKAAIAYQRYLDRYKYDQNTYELWYLYAETLFYSENYKKALAEYLKVRDFKKEQTRQEEAAFSAIISHMELIQQAIKQRKLVAKPVFLAETEAADEVDNKTPEALSTKDDDQKTEDTESDGPKKIQKEEIPPIVETAITLRNTYLDRKLSNAEDPERVPILVYKVGEIYMDYKHFDEARKRFEQIIKEYSKSSVALNAAKAIIEMYKQEENWTAMSQWADIIAQSGLGDEAIKVAGAWKVGALFKTAKKLFEQKKYKEAAEEYLKLVRENPENEDVPSALNNAAVSYEKARMFDSATQMYEKIFNKYSNSSFSENALFRVAYNASRFYDYDRAIRTFEALAKRYPKGQYAADAAYNAARLLEQNQFYKRSAKAVNAYIRKYSDHERAPDLLFSSAKSYEKLGDSSAQLRVYELFNKTYGSDPKHSELFMQGLAESIKIYQRQNNQRKVKVLRKRMIKEFEKRNLPKSSMSAKYAAEASFALIEPRFESFTRMKIKGSMRKQGKIIEKMKKEIAGLTSDYGNMLKYKSLDWSIAAFYRIGLLRQLFAEALYNLPIPEALSDEEKDIYITTIEELALPIEDEAVSRFETAYKKAREFRIVNDWTRKILLSLNKYKPAEYPTFKEEKRMSMDSLLTTSQFLLPVESAKIKETMVNEDKDAKDSNPKNPETTTQTDEIDSIETEELKVEDENTRDVKVGKKKAKLPPSSKQNSDQQETKEIEEIEEIETIELDEGE